MDIQVGIPETDQWDPRRIPTASLEKQNANVQRGNRYLPYFIGEIQSFLSKEVANYSSFETGQICSGCSNTGCCKSADFNKAPRPPYRLRTGLPRLDRNSKSAKIGKYRKDRDSQPNGKDRDSQR